MRLTIIAGTLGVALLGGTAAWPQTPDSGPSPHGQIPGPNTTTPQAQQTAPDGGNQAQPVPGAMPGSDAVPSTLSEKNAADDKLSTTAYTFKELSDEQRRAIYQAIGAKPPANATTAGGGPIGAEIGSVLPQSIPLAPVPDDVSAELPSLKGYEYVKAGDKVLLVSPANRFVVGVITPQPSAQ